MNRDAMEETRKYANEAKKQICSDLTFKRSPSKCCIFCDKPLEEIGGNRLVAQKFKGIELSNKYRGGGNPDYPYQSIRLFDDMEAYITVWGDTKLWTQSVIEKAINEFIAGYHPWFCQICGNRTCVQCGSPINHPSGSDVLYDDGDITHASMLPCNCGCINPKCKKYT